MRHLSLLILALVLFGCSKDEFDPQNPKNGQIVQLFVDHYEGVNAQMLFLLPDKQPSPFYLEGFDERELGYTYKIQAKMYIPKEPMQDGPDRWFTFVKVLSKERYPSNESFEISLVYHSLFGNGPAIGKENDQFRYADYRLRPENDDVKKQLEDVILLRSKFQSDQLFARTVSIKAVVTHDPDNLGNGYLVHQVITVP